MKYDHTEAFHREVSRLPPEHYQVFRDAVFELLLPALAAGARTGNVPWPKRLRIHKLTDRVYSLTWSFSSPDGRATFEFVRDEAGDPVLIWRRIGDHRIYDHP